MQVGGVAVMIKPLPRVEPPYTRPPEATRDKIAIDNAEAAAAEAALALALAADADGDGEITPDELAMEVITTEKLDHLDHLLEHVVIDLRAVGWGLRSLFLTDLEWIPAWKEFQLGVVREAVVFKEALLLMSTCIVCHMQRFFLNCYVQTGFAAFRRKIMPSADQADECGFLCRLLSCWYINFADELASRVPKAEEVLGSLIIENKNHRKSMMILKMKWTPIDNLLLPLILVKDVGSLAAPYAVAGGMKASDYSKEVESKTPGETATAAIKVLCESLIPVCRRLASRLLEIGELFAAMDKGFRELRFTKREEEIEKDGDDPKKKKKKKQPEQEQQEGEPEKVVFSFQAAEEAKRKAKAAKKEERKKIKRALDRFETYYNLKPGSARIEQIEATPAGVDGWAAAKEGQPGVTERSVHIEGALLPTWATGLNEKQIHQFLDDTRKFHYDMMSHKSARVSMWCDELVSLFPFFDYDLEFVPAYKLRDKGYVARWIEGQKSKEGTPLIGGDVALADTVRDVTKNSEILLSLPRLLPEDEEKNDT